MTSANYGLDAPAIVRGFLLGGPLALGLGLWNPLSNGTVATTLVITGALLLVEGLWMVYSSRVGKLAVRDSVLDALKLRGDEVVLDLGCGHGLLLIGAARRVPRGRAVGIDRWSQIDQADNRKAATLDNATIEGVNVEVLDGDMRELPFADGSVDVIVGSLSVHNIAEREGRARVMTEIARVLRPGGKVALIDFQKTAEYAADLRANGLENVQRSGLSLGMFPWTRVVTGNRPQSPRDAAP
jgi:SAM-dependent methyltransferase